MLTEIQRDAIAAARRGDFSLVDAMELSHRISDRQCDRGHLSGGRLRMVSIVTCFGRSVSTLNGDLVFKGHSSQFNPDPTDDMLEVDLHWANSIVGKYRKDKADAAEAADNAAVHTLDFGVTP